MNHTIISNHLPESIYIYLLNYQELYLDLLFKTGFHCKEKTVEINIDVLES